MASLNLALDYFDHPKTKRLIRLLGKGSEVLPLKVWVYTARYFPKDGRLTGISTQEIEAECRWWGTESEMVRVMLMPDVLFLELDGTTLVVHDWIEHEGHLSVYKERAKKAAKVRWDEDASSDASSIPSSNAITSIALPALQTLQRDANRLIVSLGIEARCGPSQRHSIGELIAIDGYSAAESALRAALKKCKMQIPSSISYASKIIGGNLADRAPVKKSPDRAVIHE